MSAPTYNILGRFVPKTNGTVGASTTPPASALVTGELATNSFLGDLFSKKEDGAVALVGANAKQIAGRAVTSATPADGQYLKWDTTTGQFIYAAASVSASASAPVLTTFTGNGTQTLFPINGYTNNTQTNYLVSVGGVVQKPDNGTFTVSASGIQLSSAPASGVPGFVLAFQAPVVSSALGNTTAEEIDRAFRGSDTGVLAIGNSNYYSITNTDATIAGCPVTVVSDSIIRVSGFVPYASVSVRRTSGSNILTAATSFSSYTQAARPGHLIIGSGIPDGTTIVSVSSTQIVMSAAATSTSTGFSAQIKAGSAFTSSTASKVGFPLALTGFISGVFTIAGVNSTGANTGSVNVYCRSNAAIGATGSVDAQACSVRSIAIGFGAGILTASEAVQLGNASGSIQPSDTSSTYSNQWLVSVGNETKAAAYGVAIGATSLAQTSGAVALGYGAYAGDDTRDNLPYDTLICSGTTGTNTLNVVCGDVLGISIGMAVTGTGIPANTTIADIPSTSSLTISANLTATISASAVSLAYPVLNSGTATVLSGSNVIKINETLGSSFWSIGDYITATQFPAGTRIINSDLTTDGTNYYDVLVLSRDATATSSTAAISNKSEGRFRRILTGASIAANSATYTVSSTAGIASGDSYEVLSADGATFHGTGKVARVLGATIFYGSFWNSGAAMSSKILVFKKSSSAVAIGYNARAVTGELGLCNMNVQATSGTANVAFIPINVGGKDYCIPLNAKS